jgi:UDP-N-acetylmuramoylalanine--D-glutamate ligase
LLDVAGQKINLLGEWVMQDAGQRVLVVGGGKSGLAAAGRLLRTGAEVFITDREPKEKIQGLALLGLDEAHLILEREPDLDQIAPELLVLSPGVSPQLSFIQTALSRGIPVWSEVELALRDSQALIVAITGSNGKTTTTTLIGALARATGRETVVAGNIGIALSGQVDQIDAEGIVVAELSSFQLEFIDQFRSDIALILNITPDHLDRHGTLENYAAAKARVLENQTEADLAVLNWDDPMVREMAGLTKARVVFFSSKEDLTDGICLQGKNIVLKRSKEVIQIIGSDELLLKGTHNLENVMAAVYASAAPARDCWKICGDFVYQ